MQNNEWRNIRREARREFRRKARNRQGSALVGLLILGAGAVLLLRQLDVDLPHWLFTWPMILVVVGLFAAIQTGFRDFGPFVILGVGAFFLAGKIYPDYSVDRFVIPVVLMAVGLVVILSPRRKFRHRNRDGVTEMADPPLIATEEIAQPGETSQQSQSSQPGYDKVEIVSIFGNVKKVVYSKKFSGGEVISIFGGAELNLSQADITGPVHLEMVQIFGGAKLIVPAHWEVRSEAVAILGGIDDKRPPQTITSPDKVLILEGTVAFGGIEIRSY